MHRFNIPKEMDKDPHEKVRFVKDKIVKIIDDAIDELEKRYNIVQLGTMEERRLAVFTLPWKKMLEENAANYSVDYVLHWVNLVVMVYWRKDEEDLRLCFHEDGKITFNMVKLDELGSLVMN